MTEEQHQITLIQWADALASQHPELALLYHVPNGGYRARRTAGRMKAAGLRRGCPDLCLPVARHGFHGLYIELKADKGRATPEQLWWIDQLRGQGYRAEVCHGWIAAAVVIAEYLGLPEAVTP